jgi:hypothetical protein
LSNVEEPDRGSGAVRGNRPTRDLDVMGIFEGVLIPLNA